MRIVRAHVLAGRTFTDLADTDRTVMDWVPIRRTQLHRTHRKVIGTRATTDHAALRPIPVEPYLVAEAHLRRVGNDALISFEALLSSVPADRVRAGQRVQVRAGADNIAVATLDRDGGTVLAAHARSQVRGAWVVDPLHTGHDFSTVTPEPPPTGAATSMPRTRPTQPVGSTEPTR